jgi:hypothetical protein
VYFVIFAAMKKLFLLCLLALFSSLKLFSQTNQQSAWVSWLSSYKTSEKWGVYWDVQVRSADDAEYLRTLIIRPGVSYYFNKSQNATLGYAFIHTFNRIDNIPDNDVTEHRIWEQFIQNHKISSVFALHRFRLEQRFIERQEKEDLFSQRLRYTARFTVPLQKYESNFEKGFYIALQNEVFLHLRNKKELNNSTFDQNRFLLAFGKRLSKKVDIDLGYLNQYVNKAAMDEKNHVIQIGINTRF